MHSVTKIIGTVAFALAISFCVNASATLNLNPSVPGTPNITFLVGSSKQVKVSFTVPSNGGSTITQYTVTPYIGGVAQTTTSGKSSPITVTGLTNGVSYTFTVYATNSDGNSASSNPSNPIVPNPNIYYLSSSMGNDNNTLAEAQNPATPWKTLTKLNTIMKDLLPGDEVLFNKGDTFPGTIDIKVSGALNNPITFSAYGTGNKPLFDSRLLLTNWNNVGNNLWEATNPLLDTMPFALYINDSLKPLGRYPVSTGANGGFLNIDALYDVTSTTQNTQFTCYELPKTIDFTGAEVIVKSKPWTLDQLPGVVEVGDTTIAFASSSTHTSHPLRLKQGFFFQNHPTCLFNDGDWCYKWQPTDSILLYSTIDPNTRNIKVANTAYKYAITDSKYSYITINGLAFIGTDSAAIIMNKANYFTISNCDFRKAGMFDIYTTNCDSVSLLNNSTAHSQARSVVVQNCTHVSIIGNILDTVAMVAGMDLETQLDLYSYVGMYVGNAGNFTCNCLIQDNILNGTGYHGLYFQGSNVVVNHNLISNFAAVVDDCGGIYTFTGSGDSVANRSITNNIVLNGIGNGYGGGYGTIDTTYKPASGIDWDATSPFVTVTGNTIANCAGYGLTWGYSANTVKNNTVYNCGAVGLNISEQQPNYTADTYLKSLPNYSTANDIENNIFVSTAKVYRGANASGFLGRYSIGSGVKAGFGKLGIINNNVYCNPYLQNDVFEITGEYTDTSDYCSLSEWQALTGYDSNSTGSPVSFPLYSSLIGNNLVANGTFDSNTNGWVTENGGGSHVSLSIVADKLYGNCLQISLSGSNPLDNSNVYYNLPAIIKGKTYLLTFSSLGTKNGFFTVGLNNADAYTRTVNLTNSRNDYQMLFTATNTTAANVAQLMFRAINFDSTFYLGNVQIIEAIPSQDSNYVRFAYNSTHTDSSIIADKNYITPNGKTYSLGSLIPIPSFGSVILFKDTTAINLPINFIGISATKNKEGIKVEWDVSNEGNISHYLVERSSDGISFNTIDSINANGRGTYQVLDNHLQFNGNNLYYRIKAVSATGEISYTNIAKVTYNVQLITYNLFPNPLNGNILNVSLTNVAAGKYVVSICNLLGKKVGEQTFSHNGGSANHPLAINNTLAAGIYSVVIRAEESSQIVYYTSLSVQ